MKALRSARLAALCAFGLANAAYPALPVPDKEFAKGVLYGKVLDSSGKPVPGATVALRQNGKVLVWTKTSDKGEYALAADPKVALNLKPSHGRSLLEACAKAAGDVAMAPVKAVAGTVSNPGQTIRSTVVSVASGTPAPLAAQAVTTAIPTAHQTAQNATATAATAAVDGGGGRAQSLGQKGAAEITVSATGFKDAQVTAGAYWLASPEADKQKPIGVQAWLEAIKLAPTQGDAKSDIVPEALNLSGGAVEPTMVEAGSPIKIKVKLNSPPGPDHQVRVFARLAAKDTVVELKQDGTDKTIFSGSMTLDQKTPPGDTSIAIGAVKADPVEVRLNPKKPDPLLEFVRRFDDMNPAKPYQYDPYILASQNRADVKLTVLAPKRASP